MIKNLLNLNLFQEILDGRCMYPSIAPPYVRHDVHSISRTKLRDQVHALIRNQFPQYFQKQDSPTTGPSTWYDQIECSHPEYFQPHIQHKKGHL